MINSRFILKIINRYFVSISDLKINTTVVILPFLLDDIVLKIRQWKYLNNIIRKLCTLVDLLF